MASTAQDPHAPLRGGGDKAKDEDLDEGACAVELRIVHAAVV